MSARGSLRCGKFFSESARCLPIAWLALLHSDDCVQESHGFRSPFSINRKQAIARAKVNITFLASIFKELPDLEATANTFLQRLAKLRSTTIEIDIVELLPIATYLFADALVSIDNQTLDYRRKVMAKIEVNPNTGMKVKVDRADFNSTRDLLLAVCWLTRRDLEATNERIRNEIVTGYIW